MQHTHHDQSSDRPRDVSFRQPLDEEIDRVTQGLPDRGIRLSVGLPVLLEDAVTMRRRFPADVVILDASTAPADVLDQVPGRCAVFVHSGRQPWGDDWTSAMASRSNVFCLDRHASWVCRSDCDAPDGTGGQTFLRVVAGAGVEDVLPTLIQTTRAAAEPSKGPVVTDLLGGCWLIGADLGDEKGEDWLHAQLTRLSYPYAEDEEGGDPTLQPLVIVSPSPIRHTQAWLTREGASRLKPWRDRGVTPLLIVDGPASCEDRLPRCLPSGLAVWSPMLHNSPDEIDESDPLSSRSSLVDITNHGVSETLSPPLSMVGRNAEWEGFDIMSACPCSDSLEDLLIPRPARVNP